jgi:hypothetical protein
MAPFIQASNATCPILLSSESLSLCPWWSLSPFCAGQEVRVHSIQLRAYSIEGAQCCEVELNQDSVVKILPVISQEGPLGAPRVSILPFLISAFFSGST